MRILTTLLLLAVAVPAQAEPRPLPLALQAAADYAQLARYPEWSAALDAGATDPLLDSRQPTRQSRLGPGGAGPRISVWNSTIAAQPGETVTLYAALTRVGSPGLLDGAPTGANAVTGAGVSGELTGERLGRLGTVGYRDDGVAPDTIANDGVYSAAFTLPSRRAPAPGTADSVMVTATALLPDGQVRKAAGGFQFSRPAARLTGRYADRVQDGNLVIAAEVEVLAPGRVHVGGTLADAARLPLATAQAAQALPAGRHWLDLTFYGLAFHDRNVAGSFRLASVALTSANGMPSALGPVVTDAHVTRAYDLTRFTARPFDRPELLESARRLQLDAAAVLPAAN